MKTAKSPSTCPLCGLPMDAANGPTHPQCARLEDFRAENDGPDAREDEGRDVA